MLFQALFAQLAQNRNIVVICMKGMEAECWVASNLGGSEKNDCYTVCANDSTGVILAFRDEVK